MESTPDLSDARELDARTADGIDVRLLWRASSERVFVTVDDRRTGTAFVVVVDGADALDAFHHPFAYAGAGPGDSHPVLQTQ